MAASEAGTWRSGGRRSSSGAADDRSRAVVYRGRLSRCGGSDGARARWDVLEFLVRVVDHIAEPSQQTVRYWGFYANAARGKRRKAAAVVSPTGTGRWKTPIDRWFAVDETRRAA